MVSGKAIYHVSYLILKIFLLAWFVDINVSTSLQNLTAETSTSTLGKLVENGKLRSVSVCLYFKLRNLILQTI